jgi:hypothetical protein
VLFSPTKSNKVANVHRTGYIFVRDDHGFIGSVYKKAKYVRYTDGSFTTPFPQKNEELHLGLLGPVLAAEVGDIMMVTFRNKASRSYSMHPQVNKQLFSVCRQ